LLFAAHAVRANWFSGCMYYFEIATRKTFVKG
jgi:hypothetical protein